MTCKFVAMTPSACTTTAEPRARGFCPGPSLEFLTSISPTDATALRTRARAAGDKGDSFFWGGLADCARAGSAGAHIIEQRARIIVTLSFEDRGSICSFSIRTCLFVIQPNLEHGGLAGVEPVVTLLVLDCDE
jgi:hypothetical protein